MIEYNVVIVNSKRKMYRYLDAAVKSTSTNEFLSSFICQEYIQHNVQEEQIAYGRCDKLTVALK